MTMTDAGVSTGTIGIKPRSFFRHPKLQRLAVALVLTALKPAPGPSIYTPSSPCIDLCVFQKSGLQTDAMRLYSSTQTCFRRIQSKRWCPKCSDCCSCAAGLKGRFTPRFPGE